jgi:hypothetical protein
MPVSKPKATKVGSTVFHEFRMSEETWDAVCNSLETHPPLGVLDLRGTFTDPTIAPAELKVQIQAILDMVKMNISIRTTYVWIPVTATMLFFREPSIPYLETNRFRSRIRTILKLSRMRTILGRVLLAARIDVRISSRSVVRQSSVFSRSSNSKVDTRML